MNKAVNDNIFKTTVATAALLNDINAVIIVSYSDQSQPSARVTVHITAISKMVINYKLVFYLGEGNSLTDPDQSRNALKSSVASGNFTKSLNSNAALISGGASSALSTATSDTITATAPVVEVIGGGAEDKHAGGLATGIMAAAVAVPIAVVVFAIGVSKLSLYIII
jgi:hypothetical protein